MFILSSLHGSCFHCVRDNFRLIINKESSYEVIFILCVPAVCNVPFTLIVWASFSIRENERTVEQMVRGHGGARGHCGGGCVPRNDRDNLRDSCDTNIECLQ